ncbi:MAG: SpoIID/LytB domain-containing protein [Firmicutes bacterium]|nr:SpoIID/LytB domain-containing protein [Bacillota bacterium]MDD4263907.1 SpoIID/LytB domain-containing protein [Bacillota bacterium]MDD4694270.1 SpoIID/LytB domain-containing protein [Bacillota bacterium]
MDKKTTILVVVWFAVLLLLISSIVLTLGLRRQKNSLNRKVKLYVYGQGLLELDLEEYLVGVVAAEMPASFHPEALKSQAIAARTYTLKRLEKIQKNGSQYPEGADFSNLPQEGQAWLSKEARRQNWQSDYNLYERKITEAVNTTKNQVLVYNGVLAEALYYSTAGPYTEDSDAVFNSYYPYLIAKPNPYDKHSPRYTDTKTFNIVEIEKALNVNLEAKNLTLARSVPQGPETFLASTLLEPWSNLDQTNSSIKILSRNRSGRVEKMQIGSRIFNGVDVRLKLGLRSTNFTFQVNQNGNYITFTTYGYGHGVGMSQYGADGMAKEGFGYKEILNFYYPGTSIVSANKIWE